MTYFVSYWMEETEVEVTAAELQERLTQAREQGCELVLTEVTATEMHFTEFDIED